MIIWLNSTLYIYIYTVTPLNMSQCNTWYTCVQDYNQATFRTKQPIRSYKCFRNVTTRPHTGKMRTLEGASHNDPWNSVIMWTSETEQTMLTLDHARRQSGGQIRPWKTDGSETYHEFSVLVERSYAMETELFPSVAVSERKGWQQ